MKIRVDIDIGVSECGRYCWNCLFCDHGDKPDGKQYAWCDLFRADKKYIDSVVLEINEDGWIERCDQCIGAKVVEDEAQSR